MKIIFYIFYLWLALLPLQAQSANISPPALINCKTETTCDRAPAHLEQFVAQFYEWYVVNLEELSALPWHSPPTSAQKKALDTHARKEKDILNISLTKNFGAEHTKGIHRCPGDTDFLLCSQDWGKAWIQELSAQLETQDKNNARIILTLPSLGWSGYKGGPLKRRVYLKVEDGIWKIDGVTTLPDGGK